jgi:hypothetical protein
MTFASFLEICDYFVSFSVVKESSVLFLAEIPESLFLRDI